MAVATYTKSGAKAATSVKLDKAVFGVSVTSHQLLKDAYLSVHASKRQGGAKTKTRGEVRGSTAKPWRQKGTGNARFGSKYNPIWRGGGVAFGPTGNENFTRKLSTKAKQQAVRQALSLAANEDRIKVIDSLQNDGKTKSSANLLKKIDAKGSTVLVTAQKDEILARAIRNLPKVKLVEAPYINTFDILNADQLVITKDALTALSEGLGGKHV